MCERPAIPDILAQVDRSSFKNWARRSDTNEDDEAESSIPRASMDIPVGDLINILHVMRRTSLPKPEAACMRYNRTYWWGLCNIRAT